MNKIYLVAAALEIKYGECVSISTSPLVEKDPSKGRMVEFSTVDSSHAYTTRWFDESPLGVIASKVSRDLGIYDRQKRSK